MDRHLKTALRLVAALCAMTASLCASAALGQAAAQASASSLPPPPYAASEPARRPAVYGGMQDYDRYGGGGSHPRVQAYAQAPAAPAYQGSRLSWSGKTDASPAPQRPAPYAQRAAYVPSQQPRAYALTPPPVASEAPPAGWSFVPPIGGPAPAPPPTSIYAPPPPAAPATQAVATADQTGARHYSVHRDYGIAPDPIPLPPQFFGNTADMSKPETDDPARRTVTADGKSHNALQPADGQ